jgi:hypothetical protein
MRAERLPRGRSVEGRSKPIIRQLPGSVKVSNGSGLISILPRVGATASGPPSPKLLIGLMVAYRAKLADFVFRSGPCIPHDRRGASRSHGKGELGTQRDARTSAGESHWRSTSASRGREAGASTARTEDEIKVDRVLTPKHEFLKLNRCGRARR